VPNSDFEVLNAVLARDRGREATYVLEAFDWQKWLTLEAWLELQTGDSLWIEWAEDFTVTDERGNVRTVQVKRRRSPITLNDARIRQVVARALCRDPRVTTVIWTSAAVGRERDDPLGEPVIPYWVSAAWKARDLAPLQAYLAASDWLATATRNRIRAANAAAFRAILRQVHWVTGDSGSGNAQSRLEKLVEKRLESLSVPAPASLAGPALALLFQTITRTSALPDPRHRRLTRSALDDDLLAYNQLIHEAVTDELSREPLALAAHEVRRLVNRSRAAPFSAGWFAYAYQAIAMIGREAETAGLRSFLETGREFEWWAIGGPAGIGKSRLAFEFLKSLPVEWSSVFVRPDSLRRLSEELHVPKRLFVAIDYAGSSPDEVGRFLLVARRTARDGRKLRVLLLERDVSAQAEWWQRALPPFSSRAAEVAGARFREPVTLPPMVGREHEVVTAWLKAAGLNLRRVLPKRKDRFWFDLKKKAGARPLILGFAAAGLSRGSRKFGSVEDLLAGTVNRECDRWIDRAGSGEALEPLLAVGAVAAAAGGLPLMWPGDDSPVLVHAGKENLALFVVDETGADRLPTTAELLRIPSAAPFVQKEMAKQQEDVLNVLEPVIGTALNSEIFSELRKVFDGWSVSPDLLAEYFLSQYWGLRFASPGRLPIPAVSSPQLKAQIASALALNAVAFFNALDRLREHDWSAAAYLRAVVETARQFCTPGYQPAGREAVAHKLFNSMVRVGERPPSLDEQRQIIAALRMVAEIEPDHPGIQYRLWKALAKMLVSVPAEERPALAGELVLKAPRLLGFRLRIEPERFPFENNALSCALLSVRYFEREDEPAALAPVVDLAVRIAKRDPLAQGFDSTGARLLLDLSGSLTAVTSGKIRDRRSTAAMLRKIKRLAELWGADRELVTHEQASDWAWAVSNLILSFRRMRLRREVEDLYPLITSIPGSFMDDEVRHASMVAAANVVRARLDANEPSEAERMVEVGLTLARAAPVAVQRGLLEMWQDLGESALTRGEYGKVLGFVESAAEQAWSTDDRTLRSELAYFFQSFVGRSESSETEGDIDQLYLRLSIEFPQVKPALVFAHPGLFIQTAADQTSALSVLLFIALEYKNIHPDENLCQRVAWAIVVYAYCFGPEGLAAVRRLTDFTLRFAGGRTTVTLAHPTETKSFLSFEFDIPGPGISGARPSPDVVAIAPSEGATSFSRVFRRHPLHPR